MWITSSIRSAKAPVNIALGNFDGVHLGHQRVMAQILCEEIPPRMPHLTTQAVQALHRGVIASGYSQLSETQDLPEAMELPVGLDSDTAAKLAGHPPTIYATVVTFSPHPQEYFSGIARPLLTPVAEKTWQLSQLGIHQLVMLPFNQALSEMSPETFVRQVLVEGLKAQHISVGSDFRFGKGRRGDAEGLKAIAAQYEVPVTLVPLKHEKGDRISSSRVRHALQTGELAKATHLLGRPYTLTGRVIQGKQLGRTIGFPTANLQLPPDKYLPCNGVYSVRVYGAEATPLRGVMNIGHRPTVDGQALSIEVHILNWAGDLYGQLLTVSLEGFVRPEQKFDSLDQLKAQISKDCHIAMATLD